MQLPIDQVRRCFASSEVADFEGLSREDRLLRAAELRALLLAQPGTSLRVRGARIEGRLDLSCCGSSQAPLPHLAFVSCVFELLAEEEVRGEYTNIDLCNAHLGSLSLRGCRLTHAVGVSMHVHGSIDITELAPVDPDNDPRCWCRFPLAVIDGHVMADAVRLLAPREAFNDFIESNCALNLFMSRIDGSVLLGARPVIDGGLLLDGVHVAGDVRVDGARVRPQRSMMPIALSRAVIAGDVVVSGSQRHPTWCSGTVWLSQCTIDGSLDIGRTRLDLDDGDRDRTPRISLYTMGARIGKRVTLDAVTAEGLISLMQIECSGLRIEGVVVRGGGSRALPSFYDLPPEMTRDGEGRHEPLALDVRGARIHTILRLAKNDFHHGRVDLSSASCTTLDDADVDGAYRDADPLSIDGLRYERLSQVGPFKAYRDQWLPAGIQRYHPQPYTQLARVCLAHGEDHYAWDVLAAKGWQDAGKRWRRGLLWIVYFVMAGYGVFFKFGLSPLRALATLLGLIVAGALVFGLMDRGRVMVVSQTPVATYALEGAEPRFGAQSPDRTFVANIPCAMTFPLAELSRADALAGAERLGESGVKLLIYAADVFIPLVDLREEAKCEIDAVAGLPQPPRWAVAVSRLFKASYAALGWIVTSLALLTFSGVLRHRVAEA